MLTSFLSSSTCRSRMARSVRACSPLASADRAADSAALTCARRAWRGSERDENGSEKGEEREG
jgi:hypothetical protein